MIMKKYGCKYKSGHLRKNQNVVWGCNESRGCSYTHAKEISCNDDRSYIRAKRYFKFNDIIPKHYVSVLLSNNYHYFKPRIEIDLTIEQSMDYKNYTQMEYRKVMFIG